MQADRVEAKWIDAFCEVFERCAVKPGDTAAILSETQSRALNVHIAELALLRMGARPFHIVLPTPRNRQVVPIRSRFMRATRRTVTSPSASRSKAVVQARFARQTTTRTRCTRSWWASRR